MHHSDERHHHGFDCLLCDLNEKLEHRKLKLGLLFADLAAGDDEDVGILLGRAGLLAFTCRLAPTGLQTAQTATGTLFASAVRMVDRVLGRAADRRTDTHPARATGLADDDEVIFLIADSADRGPTEVRDLADFARGKLHLRISAFFRHYYAGVSC